MNVSPINNVQPQFKAKLPQKQINQILNYYSERSAYRGVTEKDTVEIFPKLYTLLDLLDKIPGEKAEITSQECVSQYRAMGGYPSGTLSTLSIDGQNVKECEGNAYWLLYSALTEYKTKDGRTMYMPQSLFEQLWWANRDKTRADLEKFALAE